MRTIYNPETFMAGDEIIDKLLISTALLEILSDGVERSTDQVLAEFSAEYPQYFKSVTNSWVKENGFSYGAIQFPLTVVSQTLEELNCEGKVRKTVQTKKLWSIEPAAKI